MFGGGWAQVRGPSVLMSADGKPLTSFVRAQQEAVPLAKISPYVKQALLARLEHRLDVLTSGPQDVPARQQSLRNMLAWSYDLLDAGEQRLFRRLSVFVGGCTLEAVEGIYQALGDMPAYVLDGVASLIDKSLLRQTVQEGEEPPLSPTLFL